MDVYFLFTMVLLFSIDLLLWISDHVLVPSDLTFYLVELSVHSSVILSSYQVINYIII